MRCVTRAIVACLISVGAVAAGTTSASQASEASKYQRFHKNLKALSASAVEQKSLAKDVQARLQDGPSDTDISNPEEYLAELAGLVLSVTKALPGLAGAIVSGAGVLLVPQGTAVEISDALNFAQNIETAERQKVVTWTMWNVPIDGFKAMLKGNPGFADRMLVVLAGKI